MEVATRTSEAIRIRPWLTVIGEPGDEHLLEKKTVRVDLLNLSCLYYKMSKLQQMLDKREREKQNADRLK